jgi:hypothetical protein
MKWFLAFIGSVLTIIILIIAAEKLLFGNQMTRLGVGPWGALDEWRSWQEVKDIPVISAIGHWSSEEWSGSYPKLLGTQSKRIASLLPNDMSRSDWKIIMKENGFEVDSENIQVCHSLQYILIDRDTTVCAFRKVGPLSCGYYYEIVSNFQDNRLIETNVYRTNSTCY